MLALLARPSSESGPGVPSSAGLDPRPRRPAKPPESSASPRKPWAPCGPASFLAGGSPSLRRRPAASAIPRCRHWSRQRPRRSGYLAGQPVPCSPADGSRLARYRAPRQRPRRHDSRSPTRPSLAPTPRATWPSSSAVPPASASLLRPALARPRSDSVCCQAVLRPPSGPWPTRPLRSERKSCATPAAARPAPRRPRSLPQRACVAGLGLLRGGQGRTGRVRVGDARPRPPSGPLAPGPRPVQRFPAEAELQPPSHVRFGRRRIGFGQVAVAAGLAALALSPLCCSSSPPARPATPGPQFCFGGTQPGLGLCAA